MKNIKFFKYINTREFERFLSAYCYHLEDVKGFSFVSTKQYHGNILKEYFIHFKDGEKEYFKEVYFKSFNEYHQCRLGFRGDKLLEWYEDANILKYKVKDVWRLKD